MGMAMTPKESPFEKLEGIFDQEMAQYIVDLVFSVNEVLDSAEKTAAWMITKNGNLGGVSPMALILAHRGHKVMSFVHNAIDENWREEDPV